MIQSRFLPLVIKGIVRNRARSLLTVGSVAIAMFLFTTVGAMQSGVERATETQAQDTTLVVYRQDRYCPFSSRLPQSYQQRIERLPHVTSAVPVRVVVSNCRASLDVVTFRGVPEQQFLAEWVPEFSMLSGSAEEWTRRGDAALVGESLATRRKLRVGDRLTAAGISVYVAGVLSSDNPQHQNVAYTHLNFLQESSRKGGSGGVVTQFNVTVDTPEHLDATARTIDDLFASDQDPTSTSPEKAFVARAARDVIEFVAIASWLGYGALLAVFALVGNAIVLAVQERVRDYAVLQTLGYRGRRIASMILAEGAILSLLGCALGSVVAWQTIRSGRFSLTMEGLNIELVAEPATLAVGLILSVMMGSLAGAVPAWQASRREVAECFRAV